MDNSVSTIDRQHFHRRPTYRSQTDELWPPPRKVLLPAVKSRVVETVHLCRLRIDPRDVGAFVVIAVKTGESEVAQCGRTAMLFRDHMIDLMSRFCICLRHPAVFTAQIRSLPDLVA